LLVIVIPSAQPLRALAGRFGTASALTGVRVRDFSLRASLS
jgi:hypothetical protein